MIIRPAFAALAGAVVIGACGFAPAPEHSGGQMRGQRMTAPALVHDEISLITRPDELAVPTTSVDVRAPSAVVSSSTSSTTTVPDTDAATHLVSLPAHLRRSATTTTAAPALVEAAIAPSSTTTAPPPIPPTAPPRPESVAGTPPPAPTTVAPPPQTTRPAPTTTVPPPTTTVPPPTTAATAPPVSASGEADRFATLINDLRAGVGVVALARNGDLDSRARWWAEQMAGSGDLQHSSIISELVASAWSIAGENVGFGPSVDAVFSGLSASSGHYQNMVDSRFTSLGVGAYLDSNGVVWTTHLFAG